MKYIKKDLKNKLTFIGLSDKQSDVYLSALELGPCSILQIARSTDIKRSTIYGIVEQLEHKGLISIQIDGSKKKYEALPPKNLEIHLEKQKQELISCLPELETLYNTHSHKSLIRVYRGKESMHTAYAWMLENIKQKDDYLGFGGLEDWHNTDPEFFSTWPIKRREKNQSGKSLFFDSPMAREYKKNEVNYRTSIKILPAKRKFKAIKLISTNFMFIHKTGLPEIVFVIENPAVIDMYKEMFELMWEMVE